MYVLNDVHYFANISDFISTVKGAQTLPGRQTSSMSDDYSFTKTRNIEEAWDKLETGDIGTIGQAVLTGLEKLNLKSTRMTPFNDVVGFAANVPNYLMGVPKTMVNKEVKIFRDRIVNVLVNTSVSGWTSTEFITEKSIKVIEVILRLEQEGYRVNLYKMIGSSKGNGDSVLGFIKMKDDKERINLKKLMFPMTHPSMQRRLDFRFRECFGRVDVTNSSYGSQGNWDKKYVAEKFHHICPGEFLYANLHDYSDDWYKALDTSMKKGDTSKAQAIPF